MFPPQRYRGHKRLHRENPLESEPFPLSEAVGNQLDRLKDKRPKYKAPFSQIDNLMLITPEIDGIVNPLNHVLAVASQQ